MPNEAEHIMVRAPGQVLEDLAPLLPKRVINAQGVETTVNPLVELLDKVGSKRFLRRLATVVSSDVAMSLVDLTMAQGATIADLEARVESMEDHPMLQIAAHEDFGDPAVLDSFLEDVIGSLNEFMIISSEVGELEQQVKGLERIRLGLSYDLADDDEESEDEASPSPDGAASTSDTPAPAPTGEGDAEVDPSVTPTPPDHSDLPSPSSSPGEGA